jgi:hypothetical protein
LPLKIKQGSPLFYYEFPLGSNKCGKKKRKKIREEHEKLREKQEKVRESFETCKIERLRTLN